jgi:hypothetical protein
MNLFQISNFGFQIGAKEPTLFHSQTPAPFQISDFKFEIATKKVGARHAVPPAQK